MTTSSQNQSKKIERSSSPEIVLGFVVLGLLAAGTVGTFKALTMTSGLDVALCLLGSVATFGAVYYIYFGKD